MSFDNLQPNYSVFVPSVPLQEAKHASPYLAAPQMTFAPAPQLNYAPNSSGYAQGSLGYTAKQINYEQPRLQQANSFQAPPTYVNFATNSFTPSPPVYSAPMAEVKMSFAFQPGAPSDFNPAKSLAQPAFLKRTSLQHSHAFESLSDAKKGKQRRGQFAGSKPHMATMKADLYPAALPLDQLKTSAESEASSPDSKSTAGSSMNMSSCGSDNEQMEFDFDPPVEKAAKPGSAARTAAKVAVAAKTEGGWKKKIKTELCKFWLNGQPCENSQKEQGCGFAHGQEELQKKKGLSRQYLTSVCKNFLDHPSKCTYGQRCIFQHPTHDVRVRQRYQDMIQDNARYTAMRIFQDIEGSEVIYINTYAATTPRLPVFKGICSSAKDAGEDVLEPAEDSDSTEESPFSRELFRAMASPAKAN